jgi:ribosomal protein L15
VVPINLSVLESDDRIVDIVSGEVLYALGYGKSGHSFKILGNGEIKKSLKIEGLVTSASAQQAIEKA